MSNRTFVTQNFAHKAVVTKAANYTVLAADELVKINGAYTMTLPVLSTLKGTITQKKSYKFQNVHATAYGTVAAGTGNTIGGRASIVLRPGESIIIEGSSAATDWLITQPSTLAAGLRNVICLTALTSGTTVQNLVDAAGLPVIGEIVDIVTTAQDTFAGDIVVKNTTGTVSTIAKSTTAGLSVGAVALSSPALAAGDLLTVESSTTNGNARVRVFVSVQTLTNVG